MSQHLPKASSAPEQAAHVGGRLLPGESVEAQIERQLQGGKEAARPR